MQINDILRRAIEKDASDTHITVGLPAMARVDGRLVKLTENILNPEYDGAWNIASWMMGECVPVEENHVRLDTDLKDLSAYCFGYNFNL